MAKQGSILVLGATGQVGRTLVAQLAAAGQSVKAATRDPARMLRSSVRPEVESVRLDYADPATYPGALEGVDRMFVLSPGVVVDSDALLGAFLDQALPRVRRTVTLTAQGVDGSDQIPHRKLELRVERSDTRWTHLRPTWFADNFHTYWRRQVHEGVLALPAGAATTAFIDARDVAACACALLLQQDHAGEALVATGPQALDYHQAAALLSEITRRPIRYTPSDDATLLASVIRDGVPPAYAEMIVRLFGMVRAGITAEVNGTVERLTGGPPRTLQAYAVTHAAALQS